MEGNGKSPLTRDQILAAMDATIEAVDVPEWGGVVHVRNMTGRQRDQFERSRYKMIGDKVEIIHENTRAALLAVSLCDANGTLLFTKEDIEALGEKNGAALDRLFDVAQRLSGLRSQELEDKIKNLKRVPSVDSGTN
jgi:hypothetical protein